MRKNSLTGELSGYYRLVESYRNKNDIICHRTLLTVGFLDELSHDQMQLIQRGLTDMVSGVGSIPFEEEANEVVNTYIEKFYRQMVKEKRIDIHPINNRSENDWQTIDLNTLKNKDIRELGAEWMCYQAINQLKIPDFLMSRGWNPQKVSLALTHIISRAVYPASEYKSSRWMKENSAVCEVTGYDVNKITKDRLYEMSIALYNEKDGLEHYLSKKTNELFDLQDKIILYDLTNTYFEGVKQQSKIAKFGRSKEKRSDARLVVMAVVVNPEGFIKYSGIYEGNKADCKTLGDMIDKLCLHTSTTGQNILVVLDAGIATDENLKMIKGKGYDYLCVSRSTVKDFKIESGDACIEIRDKKDQKIELRKIKVAENTDYFLYVKSETKALKEYAMNSRFKERFEDGLAQITASMNKKSGVKQIIKVHERIGRLKQKYPSIQRYYQIDVEADNKGIAKTMNWVIKPTDNPDKNNGVYFLRTSLDKPDEKTVWMIYNTIREIEYTFRVLKTDLDLRPIFHQNDVSTMAHLHLGLLAYWLVNTIRYQLKQNGINCDWREIVRIMNTQKCVTTVAQNKQDEVIFIRKCSEPNIKVKQLYDALKYKYIPFVRKKSVVLKLNI